MAGSLHYFAATCCIFLVFQQVADSTYINCWACTSCGPTSSSWTQTWYTYSGVPACYKYVTSSGSVTRAGVAACSPGPDTSGGTTYCCLSDYCNGSVSLSSSFGLAFALLTAVYIFKTVITN